MIKHEKLNILLRKCIASTFSRAVVTGRYISAWPIRCKHGWSSIEVAAAPSLSKPMASIASFCVESFDRPDEAIVREKQLKRWKRAWKIEVIRREDLEWRDLSDLLV